MLKWETSRKISLKRWFLTLQSVTASRSSTSPHPLLIFCIILIIIVYNLISSNCSYRWDTQLLKWTQLQDRFEEKWGTVCSRLRHWIFFPVRGWYHWCWRVYALFKVKISYIFFFSPQHVIFISHRLWLIAFQGSCNVTKPCSDFLPPLAINIIFVFSFKDLQKNSLLRK